MAEIDEPWQSVAREAELGCYCKGKIILHVVDMLTYPRPVRKFEVRLVGFTVEEVVVCLLALDLFRSFFKYHIHMIPC